MDKLYVLQKDLAIKIERVVENFKKKGEKFLTPENCNQRVQLLYEYWSKFLQHHENIVELSIKKEEILTHDYFKEDLYTVCEENYLTNITTLKEMSKSRPECEVQTPATGSNQRSLPRIALPHFDGNLDKWHHFISLYDSLVHLNKDLHAQEKFHYLSTRLTGEALSTISSFALEADNYELAYKALKERYENPRRLATHYLQRILKYKPSNSQKWQQFLDVHQTATQALQNLSIANLGNFILFQHTYNNLDITTQTTFDLRWNSTELPQVEDLLQYVRLLAQTDELHRETNKKSTPEFNARNTFTHIVAQTARRKCSACRGEHFLFSCPIFKEWGVEQKTNHVKSKNLCVNCLGFHKVTQCNSAKRCFLCSGKHHTSLHAGFDSPEVRQNPVISPTSMHVTQIPRTAVLTTAAVLVESGDGATHTARVLLDQGSEISIITESLVQRLRLPRRRASNVFIKGIGDSHSFFSRGEVELKLTSRLDKGHSYKIRAQILPKLTSYIPRTTGINKINYFDDIILADPETTERPIELILGTDVYAEVLLPGLLKHPDTAIIAQKTTLGWILSGAVQADEESPKTSLHCCLDVELSDLVEQFIKAEEYPTAHPPIQEYNSEEKECENYYQATHSRDSKGRYIVRLPFRVSPKFGDTKSLAISRLNRLEGRFKREEPYRKAYVDFLREYQEMGHMKKVTIDEPDAYYIPHHGVWKASSSTTKLRVVFDASSRPYNCSSLNDLLHTGPQLLPNLIDVLTKWRMRKIAFAADIEKMYRQIWVHQDDQKFQRIVWRASENEPIEFYQLQTVTYGTSCAPYLAIRTIHQLAEDEGDRYPIGRQVLKEEIYVDDILSGANTIAEATIKRREVYELLKLGGFTARKWVSNSNLVVDELDDQLKEKATKAVSILGLHWEPETDCFRISLPTSLATNTMTKRIVLSKLSQIFDPLGFLAPVTVLFKIFFQSLWLLNLEWDEPLPIKLRQQWEQWYNQLAAINNIRIQRWLEYSSSASHYELHVFCDASEKAYAAVVYLRSNHGDPYIAVNFVMAKTRVAPLKKLSIPRLELSAAKLAAKLISHIRQTHKLTKIPLHMWTDSTAVWNWVRSHPSKWKTYVANRVSYIQELIPDAKWHHVTSKENPADVASRGIVPTKLQDHEIWWRGPNWLKGAPEDWPTSKPSESSIRNNDADQERRPSTVHIIQEIKDPDIINRYSSLTRLTRIIAWMFRFASKTRNQDPGYTSVLQTWELENALTTCIKIVQQKYFATEMSLLKKQRPIQVSSPLTPLDPFLDSKGLLRVGGRLKNSYLLFNQKHPIVLPHASNLSQLVISSSHSSTLHGGLSATLNHVRQKFWILRARQLTKRYTQKCTVCRRYKGTACNQKMGDLPSVRVNPGRPFQTTGVDYAGPFFVTPIRARGQRSHKAFIALFICMTTRAVHLELVSNYTAEAFLAALRRFISRRGMVSIIISDNGTNFVGANKEIKSLFNMKSREGNSMFSKINEQGIQWRFNPPCAPHFGGLWEAAVKSVKFHLRRIIGSTILSVEEFTTLLTQIEAILNSRPLLPVHDDMDSLDVLTPAHFLIGAPLTSLPEPNLEDTKISLLSRWRLIQQMRDCFWRRWSTEYLNSLTRRGKWRSAKADIKPGAIVLVKRELTPPGQWPLARVEQVYPGTDGHPRVLALRTSSAVIKRPLTACVLILEN